jgi:hypothetical protein
MERADASILGARSARRALIAPLVAALLLRLIAMFWLASQAAVVGDAVGYLLKARAMAAGGALTESTDGQVRPPLYAMLVSLGLDDDPAPDDMMPGVFLLQILADLGTIAISMSLARRRFGDRAAAATGWALACWPLAILFSSTLVMAETAACFTAALALWSVDHLFTQLRSGKPGLRAAALTGVALGISVLTKELMLLLPLAVVCALIKIGKAPIEAKLKAFGIMSASFMAALVPFSWMTAGTQGKALPTGTYGYLALIYDNAPKGKFGQDLWVAQPSIEKRVEMAQSVFADAFFEYPALTAHRAVQRLKTLLGPEIYAPALTLAIPIDGFLPQGTTPRSLIAAAWKFPPGTVSRAAQIVFSLSSLVLFVVAALGVAIKRFDPLARVAWYHTAILLIVVALTVSMERYRMTLVPALAPFIGLGISTLLSRRERAELKPRAIVTAVVVLLLLGLCMFVLDPPSPE